MTDVFVSYSSEDRERVAPLVRALEAQRWDVWWDRDIEAGRSFDREIEKAIDAAGCVVVVWSQSSVESEWVRTEANEGLERGVLVPVAIDAVRPPLAFRRTQTIDLVENDALDAFVQAIAKFVPLPEGGGDTPYVGRDQELERVASLFSGIAEPRRGSTLLVAGEAGVGKSRFIDEITRRARDAGVVVLSGHSIEMDGAPPYQPVIDQIEHAMRIVPRENLRAALGENAPEVAKLLPQLRRMFPDIPEAPELAPDQERRFLLTSFCEYIIRAGEKQPMALVFEDLHWADQSTCILFRHLADRLQESHVIVVGTYRDTDLGPDAPFGKTLEDLHRERLCAEIRLDRLDREAVGAMIAAMARRPPPDVLVELVYSETDGNPFFVEEVYRHLEEADTLFTETGDFRTDVQIADTEVPQGVKLVIERRLDRLSDDCRQALTTAAVIGRTFDFELLLDASGQDDETLLDAIDEAQAATVIEDTSRDREARYHFVHEQIRQTLLGGLSLPRRQRRHLAIADALEATYARNRPEVTGAIAHHLYRAGRAADPERTARYIIATGDRSLTALAFEDALRSYDVALEVLAGGSAEDMADVHRKRARCLRGAARIDDALDVLAQGLDGLSDGDEATSALRLDRAQLLVDLYRGGDALPDITWLVERARANNDAESELEAQQLLADAHYSLALDREGYAEKARDSGERVIELARQQGDRRALARSLLTSTHYVDFWIDYLPQALANLNEAHQIAHSLGDVELELDAQTMGLRVHQFSPIEFEVAAEATLARLEERRDPFRLKEHLFWMIRPIAQSGKLERSVTLADRAIEMADRIGVEPVQYPTFKALALIDLGRYRDAEEALALEVSDLPTHRFGAALQSFGHAVLQHKVWAVDRCSATLRNLVPEAVALDRQWMTRIIVDMAAVNAARSGLAVEQLRLLEESEAAVGFQPGRMGQAELALARGDAEHAHDLARVSVDKAASRELKVPYVEAAELLLRSLVALERWDEAKSLAEDAIGVAEAIGLCTCEWRLRVSNAAALDALGDSAAAEEQRSRAAQQARTLAGGIDDRDYRTSFESQPAALALA